MKRLLLLSLIPIFGFGLLSLAQGDLIISPARLVFDNKKQMQEHNLVNIGKGTAVYTYITPEIMDHVLECVIAARDEIMSNRNLPRISTGTRNIE